MKQLVIALLLTTCFDLSSQELISCPPLMEEASTLPLSATLKLEQNGFLYLDLDDRYIHDLIKWIEERGFEKPAYFSSGLVGAHITIVMPDEWEGTPPADFSEMEVFFTLKSCKIVHALKKSEISEYFLIIVEAPSLHEVRENYKLPPPPFDFHITIRVKKSLIACN